MLILPQAQQQVRNYKMYTYQLTKPIPPQTISQSIYRSDGAYIPIDQNNADYQAYLDWVTQGNKPLEAE